ncbi:MAG: hypothetical protein R3B13_00205 [Polyangiaceae bacterium]
MRISASSFALVLTFVAFAPGCGSDDDSGGSGGSSSGGASTGGGAGSGATGATAGSGGGGGASGAGAAGGAGGSTFTQCNEAAAVVKTVATNISCKDGSAQLRGLCDQLYTASKCTTEFDALLTCVKALPTDSTAWDCTNDGPDIKAGSCDTENTAFETCTSAL